eukprot:6172895-Pleurochrysis_carterae.AAC.2
MAEEGDWLESVRDILGEGGTAYFTNTASATDTAAAEVQHELGVTHALTKRRDKSTARAQVSVPELWSEGCLTPLSRFQDHAHAAKPRMPLGGRSSEVPNRMFELLVIERHGQLHFAVT